MRPIQINQKSWHFVLATRYGRLDLERGVYSCQYIRRCLLGLLVASGIALVAGLFLSSWLTFVFALFSHGPFVFTSLPWWMQILCQIPIVATSFLCIFIAIGLFMDFIRPNLAVRYEARYQRRRHKQPRALKRLYRSWKDKLCVQLEFTLPVRGTEVETDE